MSPEYIASRDLYVGQVIPTLAGPTLTVGSITPNVTIVGGTTATVTQADVAAGNAIVHVINGVGSTSSGLAGMWGQQRSSLGVLCSELRMDLLKQAGACPRVLHAPHDALAPRLASRAGPDTAERCCGRCSGHGQGPRSCPCRRVKPSPGKHVTLSHGTCQPP